jgi:hypothetical protein
MNIVLYLGKGYVANENDADLLINKIFVQKVRALRLDLKEKSNIDMPICDEKNTELADKLRKAFAEWYYNGHTDESDPNTIILRIRLKDAVLLSHSTRYDIDFDTITSYE